MLKKNNLYTKTSMERICRLYMMKFIIHSKNEPDIVKVRLFYELLVKNPAFKNFTFNQENVNDLYISAIESLKFLPKEHDRCKSEIDFWLEFWIDYENSQPTGVTWIVDEDEFPSYDLPYPISKATLSSKTKYKKHDKRRSPKRYEKKPRKQHMSQIYLNTLPDKSMI